MALLGCLLPRWAERLSYKRRQEVAVSVVYTLRLYILGELMGASFHRNQLRPGKLGKDSPKRRLRFRTRLRECGFFPFRYGPESGQFFRSGIRNNVNPLAPNLGKVAKEPKRPTTVPP